MLAAVIEEAMNNEMLEDEDCYMSLEPVLVAAMIEEAVNKEKMLEDEDC